MDGEREREREKGNKERHNGITSSSPSLKTDKPPTFLPEIAPRKPGASCEHTSLLLATNVVPSSSAAAVSSSCLEKTTVCVCVCVCV